MNRTKIRILIAAICLILTVLLTQPTRAQNDGYLTDSNTRGLAPGNSFQVADIDYINLGNGALNLHIPLFSRKGRGLDSGAFVTYSSKIWKVAPYWDGILANQLDAVLWTFSDESGFNKYVQFGTINSGVLTYDNYATSCWDQINNVQHDESVDYGFKYVMSDGSAYQFPNRNFTSSPPGPPFCIKGTGNFNVGYSDNGTFELDTTTPPYTVHFKDGRKKVDAGAITDTNGNFIDSNGDTLKRTITNNYTSLTVLDSNGSNQTYTLQNSGETAGSTQFPTTSCGSGKPINQYQNTLGFGGSTTVTLPDGRTYVFTYDPTFDEVTKVTLPTGGYIRYQYTTLASWDKGPYYQSSCATSLDSRRVSARFVSPDGNSQHEQQWQYSYSSLGALQHQTAVTDPLGNVTVHTFGSADGTADLMHETLTQYYDNASHLLRTVAQSWTGDSGPVQSPFKGAPTCASGATNWRTTSETTTLADTNQVKQIQTNFDSYTPGLGGCGTTTSRMNVTSQLEYDWGTGAAGPLLRRTVYTYLHDSNSYYVTKHILDRVASKTVYDNTSNQCQGQSRACAQTNFGYDTSTISTKSGVVQHDYTNFPSTMIQRGNPTTISRWRNTDGNWLTTTNYYNELGNLIQTTDPLSDSTYFDYTDSWSGTACVPSGGTGNAFVTKTTNALSQFVTAKYYPCTSLLASATDLNSLTTSFNYDGLDRVTLKALPDGGQTTNCFSDISGSSCYSSTLPPYVVTTVKASSALNLSSTTKVDGLGRIAQTQLNSDPDGITYLDTTYDALGRESTVSNPYRTSNDPGPTNGIATYSYDPLGRVTQITQPDGSLVFTSYSGNTTTVTDEAGKKRKSVADALGRLIQIFEDPASLNYEMDYTYDALGNLLTVSQKGGDANSANWRPRAFTYNSLSQLLTANNPESGTITYTYDANGNLATKVAPAPNQTGSATVTTTYSYDALNRLTQKSYSDGTTPTVKYGYDAVAPSGCTLPTLTINNGIGKRTGMCDAAGTEAWSYDITSGVGWKTTDARTTNSVTKTFAGQNNFDRSPATITYPSTRVLTYTPGAAGRSLEAKDLANSINYVTAAHYSPPGALASLTNGTGLVSTSVYNSRLQPCWFYSTTGTPLPWNTAQCTGTATAATILDMKYGFNLGAGDNGNVASITNNKDPNRSQLFSYDALNRIATAKTTSTTGSKCWDEQFGYDPWANLLSIGRITGYSCSNEELLSVNASTKNQISGYTYDSAGNLITIPGTGGSSYSYNAENQVKQATSAGTITNYAYDGDGRRAEKLNSSGVVTKLYWYGTGSDPLDETDSAGATSNSSFKEYIFFGGKRIARRDSANTVNYYFADHLGTARIVTDSAGTVPPLDDSDFYPFGGERIITSSSGNSYKFTGKERDSESGLDNFGARYDSSSLGRFMSPDPVTMLPERLRDPQQINLYAYTRNNPLRFIDPTGTTIDDSACQANKSCRKWEEKYKKSKEGQAQWKKLDDDKKLLVKLQWDKKAKDSVTSDYKWDSSGKLTEATVTLAPRTGDPSYQMSSESYPFGSTITDSSERHVYVFGHELAHVEDSDTSEGRNSIQEVERLFPDANARFNAEGSSGYAQDKDLQATFAIIRADNKRNENVADQRAKGIVESYRACESSKGCK